ncbi:type II secretion system F family protein [Halanaerobacter jeridensis]|uniref:Type II secretory pathway component PulF n=1 Tax=Halanaerobacter jeridensis TaxID=706427 RepID=A0A938XTM4_9FIRM|nr:type II secretion system F family protein [Halanaerobacter jeridensis]MBM7557521.1 type II secretory pathway component PulF [Halanaerobacter jeridensis]
MAQFDYQAIDEQGQEVTGTIEALDTAEAKRKLQSQQLYVFELKVAGTKPEKEEVALKKFNLLQQQDHVLSFTKQLSNLLAAGIQLGEALEIIAQLTAASEFSGVVKEIYNSIKGGQNFAEALEEHPEYFSKAYIGMIKAGEEGGFLDLSCQRLSQDLENNKQLKSFMITSLIYPIVLIIVTILAVIVMITYVLPKFVSIYENYDSSLPYLTELLLQTSQFMTRFGLLIGLGLLLLVALIYFYYQQKRAKEKIDAWLLQIPLLGNLLSLVNVTKIARNLGTMLESGVPLLKALQFSQHVTNNAVLKKALAESSQRVKKGSNLAEALEESKVFSPLMIHMTGIGERTGKLPAMLLQLADNFEESYRGSLEKIMKIFEPVIILVMGIVIGLIVVAMLLPILNINTISL